MKPIVREKTDRKAVTPVLTADGGKYYAGVLESHHHFLLNYRRHRLREFVLLSEKDAVWLSTAKGLMTEEPYRALKRQETRWIHLLFSAFFLGPRKELHDGNQLTIRHAGTFMSHLFRHHHQRNSLKINIQQEAPRILNLKLALLAAVPSFESSQF